MNYALVKHLIYKDWQFQRPLVIGAVLVGILSLGLIAVPGDWWFATGSILLMTVMLVLGAMLVSATTATERSSKTLPFVMTLPISMREYTTAKILGNLLIFLVPWVTLLLTCILIVMIRPNLPDGLVAYALIVLLELLLNFCLLLTAGLVSESQGWITGGIVLGNLLLQAFLSGLSSLPEVRSVIYSSTPTWNTAYTLIVLIQICVLVGLVMLTMHLQSKKTDLL